MTEKYSVISKNLKSFLKMYDTWLWGVPICQICCVFGLFFVHSHFLPLIPPSPVFSPTSPQQPSLFPYLSTTNWSVTYLTYSFVASLVDRRPPKWAQSCVSYNWTLLQQ